MWSTQLLADPRRSAPALPPAVGDESPWTPIEVARALRRRNARGRDRLTAYLLPVVQFRVQRIINARREVSVRVEAEDLIQEVFAQLFDNDAKILRAWHPKRGASLQNYVGLVAERRVISLLRSGRWTQWREEPTASDDLESHASPVESPARRTAEQQCWERVLIRARARLSSQGLHMMELLLIQERTVAEVSASTGMSTGSLYAWRSRLQKLMRELAQDLRVVEGHGVAP